MSDNRSDLSPSWQRRGRLKRADLLLGGALLIATTLAGSLHAGPARAQDRPNVVIMLADNVGYGDIGCYGAGEVRGMPTPRIDQLAGEGLRLTQYLWSRPARRRARR